MRNNQLPNRSTRIFPQKLLLAFSISLLWLPGSSTADVVIELDGGEKIVIPVDKERVKSIGFSSSSSSQGTRDVTEESRVNSSEAGSRPARNVLQVGEGRALRFPSDAAKIARDGDIVEIDSGTYHNDYAIWRQNNLKITGVGDGMAHLESTGKIPNGKAIWITRGDNISIENVEFSGAAVKDTNGAGIRHEGGDLKLENTFFHDNEFSIMSGKLPHASIEIASSRFWFQKRSERFSHGIYIGQAGRFSLIGSHIKGTDEGHQVKSRALENYILYNRIEDIPKGNSSRLIDLSNCGFSIVIGNDFHQASTTENSNVIGYGPEGCPKRTGKQMKLFVINNTLVNEARGGTLVMNFADGDVTVANNLIFGAGSFLAGGGKEVNNFREDLTERKRDSWGAPRGSAAIDKALMQPPADGVSLIPTAEFQPPVGYTERAKYGQLDAGSREKLP